MITDPFLHRGRSDEADVSSAIACKVVSFDLSADPIVSVIPLVAVPTVGLDGKVEENEPLVIDEVPYCYPSSDKFATFVPPAVGMQGFLISTNTEIGEVATGVAKISRQKNASSGFFLPTGNMTGQPFIGNPDWAEMRSALCRIAISDNVVHLEAGDNSFVMNSSGFDILCGGISLVAALKQISAHITTLEGFHTGPQMRLVDQFLQAAVPSRSEQGVR